MRTIVMAIGFLMIFNFNYVLAQNIEEDIIQMRNALKGKWLTASRRDDFEIDSSYVMVFDNNFIFIYYQNVLFQKIIFDIKYGVCKPLFDTDAKTLYIEYKYIDLQTNEVRVETCWPIRYVSDSIFIIDEVVGTEWPHIYYKQPD